MNEMQIYVVGFLTLPVIFALIALGYEVREKIAEIWWRRKVSYAHVAYCNQCAWSGTSTKKRTVKRWASEHVSEEHAHTPRFGVPTPTRRRRPHDGSRG